MKSHFDCKNVREEFLDLARPGSKLSAEAQGHMAACPGCAGELKSLQQTWSLLGEWQAPEPSAYFDSRLQARLRSEQQRPAGLLAWLGVYRWQPALAATFVVALVLGIGWYRLMKMDDIPLPAQPPISAAVSDLDKLDRNADVYDNDLLYDDDQSQADE